MALVPFIVSRFSPLLNSGSRLTRADGECLSRSELGTLGERISARYLQARGCRLLVRNFRAPKGGEADLVVRDGSVLVFVEVKSNRVGSRYRPSLRVNRAKRQLLRRACRAYLGMLPNAAEIPLRFDIVEVLLAEGSKPEVNWIRQAFGMEE